MRRLSRLRGSWWFGVVVFFFFFFLVFVLPRRGFLRSGLDFRMRSFDSSAVLRRRGCSCSSVHERQSRRSCYGLLPLLMLLLPLDRLPGVQVGGGERVRGLLLGYRSRVDGSSESVSLLSDVEENVGV